MSDVSIAIPAFEEVMILFPTGNREMHTIRSIRNYRDSLLISFVGIDNRHAASCFRRAVIEVQESNLPVLPPNKFYYFQIIGLTVVTPEGKEIGKITGILETGSNDVYVVTGMGKEYLIPAIEDAIANINLSSGTLTLSPMKGLLD